MVKKTKVTVKRGSTVGLEFDNMIIRGARLSWSSVGGCVVERLEQVSGDFSGEDGLAEGLRQMRGVLDIGGKESLVVGLSGKHVFAAQLPFRKLPPEEMAPALALELRKLVPFEVAGSTLDYQILSEDTSADSKVEVLVSLAGAGLVNRQLKVLERAGLHPSAVDVLPVAVANALWTWIADRRKAGPMVAIHIGPSVSTIVIDGIRSHFFNRFIPFPADEILGSEGQSADRGRKLQVFCDEVARSLSFYEKNSAPSGFTEIILLGEFTGSSALEGYLRRQTGLKIERMDLPKSLGLAHQSPPGRFDVAVTLAMRGGED